MELTLKALHRVEMDIARAGKEAADKARNKISITLSAYDQAITSTVAGAKVATQEAIEDAIRLNALRYHVRKLVQAESYRVGIAGLLTRMNEIQSVLSVVGLVTKVERMYGSESGTLEAADLEAVKRKFASVVQNPSAAVAREDKAAFACVFSQAELDKHRATFAPERAELETVKDRIGELNVKTIVQFQLSDTDRALLKRYGVVYM